MINENTEMAEETGEDEKLDIEQFGLRNCTCALGFLAPMPPGL